MKQRFEDRFFISMETSLKNETKIMSIVHVSVSSSLKNETNVWGLYLESRVGVTNFVIGYIGRARKSRVFIGFIQMECGNVSNQKKFGKRTKSLSELSDLESLMDLQ
jgi:hypothetical protein